MSAIEMNITEVLNDVSRLEGMVREYQRYHSLYVKNKRQVELFQAKYEAQKARANNLRDKYADLAEDFRGLACMFEQAMDLNDELMGQHGSIIPVTDIMEKPYEEGSRREMGCRSSF